MSEMCGCAGKQVLETREAMTYTPPKETTENVARALGDLWKTVDAAGELRHNSTATDYVPVTEHVWLEVPTSAERIRAAVRRVEDLLLEKNQSYGDTALNPLRILSKLDAYEGLAVRADDKLSRLKNAPEAFQEDALLDLAGYLILMLAERGKG